MHKKPLPLTYATLLFPLALVLFEFTVYIANDMVQPIMLSVIREFGVDSSWVPSSMTAFLLGGALLPWFLGPLSDRIGRRPVMIIGASFFILSCVAILFVKGIESFIVLRILQGMGLCFISAVGYAAIQEAFAEKTAVKLMALMSNVALIAPLIGPLAGAALGHVWPWRACFILIAALSSISLLGLYGWMPETVDKDKPHNMGLSKVGKDYWLLLRHKRFLATALCSPLLTMPMLGWIALSPVMLIEDSKMSLLAYGLWQVPVFGALIAGNLCLVKLTDHGPLGYSVKMAAFPLAMGLLLMVMGSLLTPWPHYFLIAGMCLISFGEGLCTAVLYRFALTSLSLAKGTMAAAVGMLSMLAYVIGVEALKIFYLQASFTGFALLNFIFLLIFGCLARGAVRHAMQQRAKLSDALQQSEMASAKDGV